MPRVTYTDPQASRERKGWGIGGQLHPSRPLAQVATVGLSSEAALARYGGPGAVRVISQEADEGDRARIEGAGSSQQHGFICVSLLRADGRILGATAVGAGAAEVIAEVSLAMSAGLSIADVALAMQPYPSHATALGVLARAAAADSLLEVRGRVGGRGVCESLHTHTRTLRPFCSRRSDASHRRCLGGPGTWAAVPAEGVQ